jgi:uncharacterized RDD family membrane protein YckC
VPPATPSAAPPAPVAPPAAPVAPAPPPPAPPLPTAGYAPPPAAPGYAPPSVAPGYAPPPAAPGYAPPPGYSAPIGYSPGAPGYTPYAAAPAAPLTPGLQYGREAFVPRLLAFLVDGLIVGLVGGVLFTVTASFGFLGPAGGILGWWFPAILMAVYMIVMEGNSGQTFGKMLLDVKVVKEDLTPITMNEAQTRAVSILLYPLLIPILLDLISASEEGQTMGDKWAHTLVVKAK